MRKRNEKYAAVNLNDRLNMRLKSCYHNGYGRSRHNNCQNGNRASISSGKTLENYMKYTALFCRWLEARTGKADIQPKEARTYVGEYLNEKLEKGEIRATTAAVYRQALCKALDIGRNSPYFPKLPERHRTERVRSRGDKVRDRNFNEAHHHRYVTICRAVGFRVSEAKKAKGTDLLTRQELTHLVRTTNNGTQRELGLRALALNPNSRLFVNIERSKGGRSRFAPVIMKYEAEVMKYFSEVGKNEKLFRSIPTAADTHSFRAEYANAHYREYARPIEEIKADMAIQWKGNKCTDIYYCQRDMKGIQLDKMAMKTVTEALGHSRISEFANSYYRG